MGKSESRTEQQLLARLETLPAGSERRAVLSAACRFKASWVELGEALMAARKAGRHTEWGYKTFEVYCRQELHIKAETVQKLTRSYAFLQQHAPESIKGGAAEGGVPALDVVDLLSQAAERTKVSPEALASIGQDLLGQGAAPNRNDVLKRLRQSDPDAFRSKAKPATPIASPKNVDLRKALLLAERLFGLLGEQSEVMSPAAHKTLHNVVDELRAAYERDQANSAQTGDSNLVHHGEMH